MLPVAGAGDIEAIVWGLILGGGGGGIKSVQRGELRSSSAIAVADITISPVDVSRSFVVLSWRSNATSSISARSLYMCATLPAPDTLRIEWGFNPPSSLYVYWQVIELAEGKVQQIATTSTNPGRVDISPVDPMRAFVVAYNYTTKDTTSLAGVLQLKVGAYLAEDGTAVLFRQYDSSNPVKATAFVVEVQ